jgi:hypothetical protein
MTAETGIDEKEALKRLARELASPKARSTASSSASAPSGGEPQSPERIDSIQKLVS